MAVAETHKFYTTSFAVVAAVIAVSAYVVITQGADALTDFLPRFFGIGLIIAGAIYLGRRYINEHVDRGDTGKSVVLWLIIGAVALSAVSFSTTLFGMFEFVSNQNAASGQSLVGWFISLGTTFGVQIIMFYIAMTLGQQLVDVKRPVEVRLRDEGIIDRSSEALTTLQLIALFVAVAMTFLAAMAWFPTLKQELLGFGKALYNSLWGLGASESQLWAGAFFLAVAVATLLAFSIVRATWGLFLGFVLFLVYLITLSISALFSFDSFYRLFQDPFDAELRRTVIVETQTRGMLTDGLASLQEERIRMAQSPAIASSLADLQQELNGLQARQAEVDDLILTQEKARLQRITDSRANLDVALERLQASYATERARIVDSSGSGELVSKREEIALQRQEVAAQLAALEDRKLEIESDRDGITSVRTDQLSAMEARIADLNTLIACENSGQFGAFPICEKEGSTVKNRVPFDELPCLEGQENTETCGFINELEELRGERTALLASGGRTGNVASQTAQLQEINTEIQDLTGQISEFTVREEQFDQQISGFNQQQAADVADRLNDAKTRFDNERAALIGQVSSLDRQTEGTMAPNVTPTSLLEKLASFQRSPNIDTFDAWVSECNTTRNALIAANQANFVFSNCQPPELAIMAQRGTAIDMAITKYEATQCSSASAARVPDTAEGADPVREMTQRTRECLTTADQGQTAIPLMMAALTELQSSYGSTRRDLNRAIADFWLGAPRAKMAALFALAIDILILIVGYLAALSSRGAASENPIPEEIIISLRRVARANSHDHRIATGFQTFMQYIEQRRIKRPLGPVGKAFQHDALFRNTLNRAAVKDEDQDLVKAMMAAIPSLYQDEKDFVPVDAIINSEAEQLAKEYRTAISQTIISFLTRNMYELGEQDAASPVFQASESRGHDQSRRPGGKRNAKGRLRATNTSETYNKMMRMIQDPQNTDDQDDVSGPPQSPSNEGEKPAGQTRSSEQFSAFDDLSVPPKVK